MVVDDLKALAEKAYSEDRMCCVVKLAERYLEYYPNNARAWYLLADAQRVLGLFGAAAVSFHNALRTCPEEVRWSVQARLGLLFSDKGDLVTAERWYKAALVSSEAQGCDWVWLLRGRCFVSQELFAEAEECFRRAIAISTEDEEALLSLATVLMALKKYSASRCVVNKVLLKDPNHLQASKFLSDLNELPATIMHLDNLDENS